MRTLHRAHANEELGRFVHRFDAVHFAIAIGSTHLGSKHEAMGPCPACSRLFTNVRSCLLTRPARFRRDYPASAERGVNHRNFYHHQHPSLPTMETGENCQRDRGNELIVTQTVRWHPNACSRFIVEGVCRQKTKCNGFCTSLA